MTAFGLWLSPTRDGCLDTGLVGSCSTLNLQQGDPAAQVLAVVATWPLIADVSERLAGIRAIGRASCASRRKASQREDGNADVFVQIEPVNAFTATDQTPARPFRPSAVHQAGLPG